MLLKRQRHNVDVLLTKIFLVVFMLLAEFITQNNRPCSFLFTIAKMFALFAHINDLNKVYDGKRQFVASGFVIRCLLQQQGKFYYSKRRLNKLSVNHILSFHMDDSYGVYITFNTSKKRFCFLKATMHIVMH